MDALETLIAAKRQAISNVEAEIAGHQTELARLRESLKISSIELAAFEKAAELRPTVSNSTLSSTPKGAATDDDGSDALGGRRRGRQPGSISHAWRKTLGYLHFLGERFDYEVMLQAAQSAGVNTTLASIRDRARDYVEQGLLEGSAEENFVVSKKAIERFKLDQAPVAGHGGGAPSVDEIEEEEEDDEADVAHDVQPGPDRSGQIPFLDE